jgi:signal peptidase I
MTGRHTALLTGSDNRALSRISSGLALVAALGALSFAGCGGDSHAGTTSDASTTSARGSTVPAAAVAGSPAEHPSTSSTSSTTAGSDGAKTAKGVSGSPGAGGLSAPKAGVAATAVSTTGTSGAGASHGASSVAVHSRSRATAHAPAGSPSKTSGGSTSSSSPAPAGGSTGAGVQPSGAPASGDVAFQVPGGSMEPTYQPESTVYYDPARTHPQIGEVIVFYLPVGGTDSSCATVMAEGAACAISKPGLTKTMVMKRVVGLEGDTIAIHEGKVIRNGQPESEPPTVPCGNEPGCEFPKPITVPAGEYYVLADNRGLVHEDSRIWGSLPQDAILGAVVGS